MNLSQSGFKNTKIYFYIIMKEENKFTIKELSEFFAISKNEKQLEVLFLFLKKDILEVKDLKIHFEQSDDSQIGRFLSSFAKYAGVVLKHEKLKKNSYSYKLNPKYKSLIEYLYSLTV